MSRSIEGQGLTLKARRAALLLAAELLATHAEYKTFVPSYGRMNPGARHKFNAFYFGKPNYTARAIIFGPWLYIHAPNVKLPKEAILMSEKERRQKHLGNLAAKVLLTSNDALQVVKKVVESFKKGPMNPNGISRAERVRFPGGERV